MLVRQHLSSLLERAKFGLLLGSLLLVLGLQPFLHERFGSVQIMDVLLPLVLLTGVLAVSGSPRLLLIGVALAVPTFALQGTAMIDGSSATVTLLLASYTAFLLFVTGTVVFFVVRGTQVTLDTIVGSACGYLLLGLLFAMVCALIEWLAPGSYSMPAPDAGAAGGRYELRTLLYFSFVTLTTLGYGDVQPLSNPARAMAVGEAVIGQLYLAILIARLVGMHISQRRS